MVAITVKTNFPDVQRQIDQLHAELRGPVLARSLNRSIEPAKPQMAREISREYRLTVGEARDALKINRATFTRGQLRLEASLESPTRRGRSLNLIHFVEKTVTMAAARKRMAAGEGGTYQLRGQTRAKELQLRFKIKRSGPWKIIPGAFIGNQGRTVFIREGKTRLPIKALQTIDLAQMFNSRHINDRVRKGVLDRFPAIFEREAKFYTDRFNARRAA